jgi:hypothetical protein
MLKMINSEYFFGNITGMYFVNVHNIVYRMCLSLCFVFVSNLLAWIVRLQLELWEISLRS